MSETHLDGAVTLHCGDCLAVLDTLPADSIDACVTDPPYHLTSIVRRFGGENAAPAQEGADGLFVRSSRGFMGKTWDGGDIAFRPETWRKVLRVLKPGAHVLAFAAPRNMGHLQLAIEAAGFETRDAILDVIDLDPCIAGFVGSLNDAQRGAFFRCIEESGFGGLLAWVFGSGFPKSHRIAFDFEKRLCEQRDGAFHYRDTGEIMRREPPFRHPLANAWAGAGTALKPAFEPIVVARKPLADGLSVAENVEAFGTGALNIDAVRIGDEGGTKAVNFAKKDDGRLRRWDEGARGARNDIAVLSDRGRWPGNVITDGSAAALRDFPADAPAKPPREVRSPAHVSVANGANGDRVSMVAADPGGSAARFFYSAKADAHDRVGSRHPTVKPVDLMQYLVRMVTVPGQTVLDPFAGTGTTGEAAFREQRRAVLIERDASYQEDIRRRLRLALAGPDERARESIKAQMAGKPVDAGPLFGGLAAAPGGAHLWRVCR